MESQLVDQLIAAKSHKLGMSQLMILLSVYESDMYMTQIANRILLSTAAVTGLVDNLEKAKLIYRHVARDRRKIVICITIEGIRIAEKILNQPRTNQQP